jgi:2,5-diketo-D-gluconate reductase A
MERPRPSSSTAPSIWYAAVDTPNWNPVGKSDMIARYRLGQYWAMAHEIPTVELAPGVQLPTIGFGTWQITGSSAYESTRAALDVGYRHIDTATMYGNEEEIGRALRDSGVDRSDVFITTKLPPSQSGLERQTIEASLKALGVDFVDL